MRDYEGLTRLALERQERVGERLGNSPHIDELP